MKNDDYIGVDEKYIPEEEKNKEISVSGGVSQKNRNRLVKGGIALMIMWVVVAIVVMVIISLFAFGMFKKGSGIIINKAQETMDKEDINDDLEFFLGEEDGGHVKSLLEEVIKINKTNKKHAITIIYESHNTKDSAEIIDIKHSIDEDSEYDSNADYDSKGYINKITITKEN